MKQAWTPLAMAAIGMISTAGDAAALTLIASLRGKIVGAAIPTKTLTAMAATGMMITHGDAVTMTQSASLPLIATPADGGDHIRCETQTLLIQ